MRRQTSNACVHKSPTSSSPSPFATAPTRSPRRSSWRSTSTLMPVAYRGRMPRHIVRAKSQKKPSTTTAPTRKGHSGGPSGSDASSTPKRATIVAATIPATTKAGAAQPPKVRPVAARRDWGPGSRPAGRWGWPSRATAIERA